jgi:hypothetical protein
VLGELENSAFSVWAKASLWGWPTALAIHVLGTALLIGLLFIVNLRLLGLFDTIAYTSLRRLFPAIWAAFAVQLLSGAVLWATKATRYAVDVAFWLKIVLVILGFGMTVYLYGLLKREGHSWEAGTAAPRELDFVVPSLLVWCGVIIAGRLTAYLGALPIG